MYVDMGEKALLETVIEPGKTLIRGFRIEPNKVNEDLDNFINEQCSWVTILDKIADQENGVLTIFLMGVKADKLKTTKEVDNEQKRKDEKRQNKSDKPEEGNGGSFTII